RQRLQVESPVKGRAAVAVKENDSASGSRLIADGNQSPVIRTLCLPQLHIFSSQHLGRRPIIIGKIKKSVLHVTTSGKYRQYKKKPYFSHKSMWNPSLHLITFLKG